ncbi:hypothetical protein J7643_18570 [bacterium]|nr:hypothetical protein [bacterium]
MRQWLTLGLLMALLPACAGAGIFQKEASVRFSTRADAVVITQRHTTGTVGPQYFHEDTLVIHGDGTWQAIRVYPYATPERREALGTGVLSPDRLKALVDVAASQPRFLDLPASSSDETVGSGTRRIDLALETGTHSVAVVGRGPEAFERFDRAITAETMPLNP